MKYPSFFKVDTNIDKIHQYLAASAFIFSVSSKLHIAQKSGKNCNFEMIMITRCHKNFYSCVQIFNIKSNSIEDIHLAHIEPKIKPPEPLDDPHTTDLFWCGLD